MKRILIAGTHSGCGKTTVTLAILSALQRRGWKTASCKCGPDYIDPMFHRSVLGVTARNLDPFFSTPEQLCSQLSAVDAEIAVLEGVMGYYDGLGVSSQCSTWSVADATDTPAILVINGRGMSASAGAILKGFRDYVPRSHIAGVIFNGISSKMEPVFSRIAEQNGLVCLGCLPQEERVALSSRHLGLVTAQELPQLQEKLDLLAQLAEENLRLDALLSLAAETKVEASPAMPAPKVRLAVAQDAAFCFLYPENLQLLQQHGCEIVPFSPLRDDHLPENIHGVYLPGGYPELHLKELSQNVTLRSELRRAILAGLPTLAECGGFLYLHETLAGESMVGVFPGNAYETKHLQRFGYVQLTAKTDNLLCPAGGTIRAHEFHYWDSPDCGSDVIAAKAATGREYLCIHGSPTLWAGFPHLYFPANPEFASSFVRHMEEYVCHISF